MSKSSFWIIDLLQNDCCNSEQLFIGIQQNRLCLNRNSTYLHFVFRLIRALLNHETIQLRHDIEFEKIAFGSTAYSETIPSLQHLLDLLIQSKSKIALSTSGTEGPPQWYTYSISNLLRNTRRGKLYRDDRWLLTYHPAHMGGIQVFLQALFNQNPIIYGFGAKRQQLLSAIDHYQISHLSATPTFYRLLLPIKQPFNTVKRISFGGERFIPQLANQLRPSFPKAKFNNIYASTETGTLFSSHNDVFHLSDAMRHQVKDINGLLYLHRSLLNAPQSEDEWHTTGDYIEWVTPNRFRIVSKKNEWVNVAGYRVHLPNIEAKINQLEGIQDCRIFCRKSSLTGRLLACKVQVQNQAWTVQSLKTKLRQLLPSHQLPRIIELVEEMPIGNTGKAIRI